METRAEAVLKALATLGATLAWSLVLWELTL